VIRAIFFDAGNTLIHMDYAAITTALAGEGIRTSARRAARRVARRVRLDASFGTGRRPRARDTGDRYLRFVLDELGVREASVVAALSAWRRAYNTPIGLWTEGEPEAEAALTLARDRGLRTACISNSNGTVAAILEGLGLARHLDFIIDSSTVGVEKPDRASSISRWSAPGVTAAEAVYVGDLYSVDVVGARGAGLSAILMDPGECWGSRDCPAVPTALAAVHHVLDGR
jgi:putative hydrolase of the HAD superfamily